MIIEMMPKPQQPVSEYKFSWFDCLLTVACATVGLGIVLSGLMAIFILYGLWQALVTMAAIVYVVFKFAGAL